MVARVPVPRQDVSSPTHDFVRMREQAVQLSGDPTHTFSAMHAAFVRAVELLEMPFCSRCRSIVADLVAYQISLSFENRTRDTFVRFFDAHEFFKGFSLYIRRTVSKLATIFFI